MTDRPLMDFADVLRAVGVAVERLAEIFIAQLFHSLERAHVEPAVKPIMFVDWLGLLLRVDRCSRLCWVA